MATMRKLLALVLCLFIVISSYAMVYAQEAPVSPTPVIEEATPTPTAQEPTQTPFIEEATPTPAAQEPTQTPFIEEATPTPASQEPTQTPFIEEATPTPTVTQTPAPEYTEQLLDTVQEALGCTVTRNVPAAVSGDMLEWTIEPTGGVAPYTVESYVGVTFANNSSRSHYTAEQTWTEGPYVQQCLAADAGVYEVNITVRDAENTLYWVAFYNQYPITVTQNPEVPAPELLSAAVTRNKTEAVVGDTLTWTITPTGGSAPYRVISIVEVHRADNSNSDVVPMHSITDAPYIQQYTANEIGTYRCYLSVLDANNTSYTLFINDLYPIVVRPEATDIQLTDTAIELKVGQEAYAGASVLPSDASQKLTYSSDDPLIATVDSTGVIQAVSAGTAVITAETMDGTGLTADVTVTVVEEPAPNSMRAFVHDFQLTTTLVNGNFEHGLFFTFGSQDGLEPYAYRIVVLRDGRHVHEGTDTEGGDYFIYDSGSFPTGYYQVFVTVTDGQNLHDTAYAAMQVTNSGDTLTVDKDVAPLVKATGVELNESTLIVAVGESQFLTAAVKPNNVSNASVLWESSDTSVVVVSPSGQFTALKTGMATITATTTDGTNRSASCSVIVIEPVTSISINSTSTSVHMGSILLLYASVLPAAANQGVTWSSSDTSIATIGTNGMVSPHSIGTVTITATAKDGSNVTAQVVLTVLKRYVGYITLFCSKDTIQISEKLYFGATVYPYDSDDTCLVFSSSNPSVLYVGKDSGGNYIEGISSGMASLIVTTTDGSGKTESKLITVQAKLLQDLFFDECPDSILVHQYKQITMGYNPTDATNKTLRYTSSDPSVLSVDANGRLYGVAPGSALITATATDGTGLSVSQMVSVKVPVSSIKLTCPDSVMVGTEFELSLEVLPLDAADRSVSIAQSNYTVAYINSYYSPWRGEALRVGQMTVTVTANDGSGVSFSKTITVTPRLVNSVIINSCPSTLRLNQTANLLASAFPANAANKTLSYTSSKPSVVRVDSNGLLRGLTLGQATITVKATDGSNVSASRVVTVLPPYPDRISMNFSNLTLALGQVSTLLKATPIPGNADATFTWSSSNKSVVTVDGSGKITAVGLGSATIYAASANGVKAYCSVTVVRPGQAVTSISLSKTSASIDEGKSLQLKASVLPQQATDKSVRWSSSNPAVASVSGSGYVNGLTPGVAVITATAASGLKAQCTISVKSLAVTQVVMSKGYLELDEGKTATLKASVLPMNARFKAVTWSSSNTAIATVSPSGKIITYKPGTVKITATAHNGIKGTCTLVVRSLAVRSLSLNKSAVVLRPGRYITLKATVQPTNARFKTVTWSSSNPAVAVAAQSGKVTATGRGTAVITATAHNGVKVSCTVTVP